MDSINKTASHLFPTTLPVGVIANWVLEVKLEILNIFKVSEALGEKTGHSGKTEIDPINPSVFSLSSLCCTHTRLAYMYLYRWVFSILCIRGA